VGVGPRACGARSHLTRSVAGALRLLHLRSSAANVHATAILRQPSDRHASPHACGRLKRAMGQQAIRRWRRLPEEGLDPGNIVVAVGGARWGYRGVVPCELDVVYRQEGVLVRIQVQPSPFLQHICNCQPSAQSTRRSCSSLGKNNVPPPGSAESCWRRYIHCLRRVCSARTPPPPCPASAHANQISQRAQPRSGVAESTQWEQWCTGLLGHNPHGHFVVVQRLRRASFCGSLSGPQDAPSRRQRCLRSWSSLWPTT
jgi:hypothetical protein